MKYQVSFKMEGFVTVDAENADEAKTMVEEMSEFELCNELCGGAIIEDWEEIEDEED